MLNEKNISKNVSTRVRCPKGSALCWGWCVCWGLVTPHRTSASSQLRLVTKLTTTTNDYLLGQYAICAHQCGTQVTETDRPTDRVNMNERKASWHVGRKNSPVNRQTRSVTVRRTKKCLKRASLGVASLARHGQLGWN